METKKSRLDFSMRSPAITPPIPAKANWPRLTFPDQPDRHTSETATIPKTMATVNSRVVPGPASNGVTMRTAAMAAPMRARPAMTSGNRLNASGIGLSTPVDSQESPASLARPAFLRCSSRASRITARKTTSVTASWRTLNPTTEFTMPRTTPAPKASGRFSIRAMTAAARAGSNRVGPAAAVNVKPWDGAFTITVRAARAPAMIQTSVDNRLTGMPNNMARSELSATDRMATPASVRNRNQPSPMRTSGTMMAIRRSSPSNSTGWMLTWNRVSGVGRPADQRRSVQPARDQQLDAPEHLGQADGGHQHDEPRGVEEPEHQDVHPGADEAADDQPRTQGDEPVPVLAHVEHHPDGAGQAAHGPVGEVDDPGGLVGQDQPQGQQPVDRPQLRPLQQQAERGVVRPDGRHHEHHHQGAEHYPEGGPHAVGEPGEERRDLDRRCTQHGSAYPSRLVTGAEAGG